MRAARTSLIILIATVGCTTGESEPDTELAVSVQAIDGTPLADASLTIDGSAVGTTDATGAALLTLSEIDDREYLLHATADGYLEQTRFLRIFAGATHSITITLAPQAPYLSIADVGEAFVVEGPRGAALDAPAGAFVDATGVPASGPAEVSLTPFDPADPAELAAYPADLRARTLTGRTVTLETWGVLQVSIRQGAEELQVAPASRITVRIPPPSWSAEPPAMVDSWTHDPATGVWVQEELGATYDAVSDLYLVERTHLSPAINVDRSLVPTCLRGRVKDAEGNGVAGAHVEARTYLPDGVELGGVIASTFSTRDGSFCVYVDRGSRVRITVRTSAGEECPPGMRDGPICTTTRDVHAGNAAVRGDYPAECDEDCKVVFPSITVGTEDPGERTEIDCEPPSDTFGQLGCSGALTNFYECFDPSGPCTYELDPMAPFGPEYDMSWDNGARTEMEFSATRGPVQRYYGPSGDLCGEVVALGSSTTWYLPGGETVEVETDEQGRTVMDCGSGEAILDPEDGDFLEGCAASPNGDAGGVACTARPGTFNAECMAGGCDEGLECCGPPSKQVCTYPSICDSVCATDGDCPNDPPFYCCSTGFYDVCLPEASCIN